MLPQHGGTPNFRLRISTPVMTLLSLVLLAGVLLTLSVRWNTDAGDLAAIQTSRLILIITLLLSIFILIAGTEKWWHTHLWKKDKTQRRHHRHHHRSPHSRNGTRSR